MKKINYILILIAILFSISFMLNASFEKGMRYVVHKIPPTWIWEYESIMPLKTEYKVGEIVSFTSKTWRLVGMRIIWEDYLFCESDTDSSGNIKERYLYTSTFKSERGSKESDWVYGKTEFNEGYILQKEGTHCYILSNQIGLPYGEEIHQQYISGPFNIVTK